nr:MAG TPA: Clr5 domain protein [Caudoviricetes sp.]
MSFKDELKGLIISQGFTMSQVNNELNSRHGTNMSFQNFSNRLRRESFSYKEVIEILDIIGCDIKIIKRCT